MGKIRLNGYTQEFRGRVGPHVFVRRANGRMFVRMRADRRQVVPTPAQAEANRRFLRGVEWSKEALKDPVKRAPLEALAIERKESIFAFAMAEFFRLPWIPKIELDAYHGQAGGTIVVSVVDPVGIASVSVVIRDDATEAVVEQGPAVRASEDWVYTATTTVPAGQLVTIEVTARNRDGRELVEKRAYA